MKITDRYFARSFVGSLLSTTGFMLGLYLLIHFLSHIKHHEDAAGAFDARGWTLSEGLARYYAVHVPEILVLFGPYAVLIAAMFAMHRANRDNELVPLYSVGVSRLRAAAPLFCMAVIATVGLMALKEQVVPGIAQDMVRMGWMIRGKDGEFFDDVNLLSDDEGNVVHCATWNSKERVLGDVFTSTPEGATHRFSELRWVSESGRPGEGVFEPPAGEIPPDFDPGVLAFLDPHLISAERRIMRRLSFNDLRRLHAKAPGDKALEALMYGHITYSLTPLVLLLFGLPLVMRGRRANAFVSLGLCMVLCLSYFAATLLLQRMGAQSDFVDPLLGAFLPPLTFGAGGLLLFESIR